MSRLIKRLRADAGFTLVELMVVVAIIGLLSAVAIPNFKKYQAKAKTSEAKLQLAAIYSAETSWFADYDNYSACLNLMGYDPGLEQPSRYYAVGFAAANTTAGGAATLNGAPASCTVAGSVNNSAALSLATTDTYAWGGGKRVGNTVRVGADIAGADAYATIPDTADFFTAAATGVIDSANNAVSSSDRWSINQNKKVTSLRIGY